MPEKIIAITALSIIGVFILPFFLDFSKTVGMFFFGFFKDAFSVWKDAWRLLLKSERRGEDDG